MTSFVVLNKVDKQIGKTLPRPLIHWLANEYIANTSCSLWQMIIQSYNKGSIPKKNVTDKSIVHIHICVR